MKAGFEDLCGFVGADKRRSQPSDLFGTLSDFMRLWRGTLKKVADAAAARRSSAEHLIATKSLHCTAMNWILIVAQCSAIP